MPGSKQIETQQEYGSNYPRPLALDVEEDGTARSEVFQDLANLFGMRAPQRNAFMSGEFI